MAEKFPHSTSFLVFIIILIAVKPLSTDQRSKQWMRILFLIKWFPSTNDLQLLTIYYRSGNHQSPSANKLTASDKLHPKQKKKT